MKDYAYVVIILLICLCAAACPEEIIPDDSQPAREGMKSE